MIQELHNTQNFLRKLNQETQKIYYNHLNNYMSKSWTHLYRDYREHLKNKSIITYKLTSIMYKSIIKSSKIKKINNKVIKSESKPQSKPVLSKPILSKPILSKPILSKPILSKPVLSKPIESKPKPKPVESKQVLSKPVLSKPVLSKPILSKPVLSKPILSKPIESHKVEKVKLKYTGKISHTPLVNYKEWKKNQLNISNLSQSLLKSEQVNDGFNKDIYNDTKPWYNYISINMII